MSGTSQQLAIFARHTRTSTTHEATGVDREYRVGPQPRQRGHRLGGLFMLGQDPRNAEPLLDRRRLRGRSLRGQRQDARPVPGG